MAFPLEDVRVLDVSQAVSGPYAGRILTDLGADVVKVEWSRGDVTNVFGQRRAGLSGLFTQMNAGKRGIAIDRQRPEGAELVRRLATRADVVIENFRPGVLDRAGLGYAGLSRENPRLVMLSISGFGRTSPEARRQAYAPVIHAESGLLSRQAALDGRPPSDLGMALADTIAALHGTVAILAALRSRDATGHGEHIDLGMLQAMVASDDYTHSAIDGTSLYSSRGEVFDAPGGPILVAADPKTLWVRFAAHTGCADPSPPGAELREKAALRQGAVAGWVASFGDRAALIEAFEAANLPWADLRSRETLFESPSLELEEVTVEIDDHAGGRRRVIRMPYDFSFADAGVRGPAPRRGQHNREVLCDWLGVEPEEVARLEAAGVLVG